MRLGITCLWTNPPEKTWSYIPWNLKSSLAEIVDVSDIGIKVPAFYKSVFKTLNYSYSKGKLISNWQYSGISDFYNKLSIEKEIKRKNIDTILQIGDIANFKVSYFQYQDLCYSILKDYYHLGSTTIGFPNLDIKTIEKRIDRQASIYHNSKGIFTMSRWFADYLVNICKVHQSKVHVVHAGINSKVYNDSCIENNYGKRKRLFFLGVDFYRKGGDLVFKAVQILRKEVDPEISLTIIGPEKWPLNCEIPEGINFLGRVPSENLHEILKNQGIMVLPSRFEAFGIAFAEALSNGIPCIGRNAFAMP